MSRVRSFTLAGSPSAPLAITTVRVPAATAASLRQVGNPAPPRPVSPESATREMTRPRPPCHGTGPLPRRWVARSGRGQQACGRRQGGSGHLAPSNLDALGNGSDNGTQPGGAVVAAVAQG